MMRLVDRPQEAALLAPMIEREILFRVLQGPQGDMLRQIARPDSRLSQVRRAVLGYFLAIREAVKHFPGAGGSIINIISILSTDPYLASSVYAATKGAVDTMTFALARELGSRNIRVNSILPGHTNTPATNGNFVGELGEKLLAGTPLGRFGEPEDISPVAVFLASDDAHWVTGESLRAAGRVRGVGY